LPFHTLSTLSFDAMTYQAQAYVLLSLGLVSTACLPGHTAQVQTKPLPGLPEPIARHPSRIFVQLPEADHFDSQCLAYEGYQTLCFVGVREALAESLASLLWPSYRQVKLRERGDQLEPGDYLLQVELNLDALPPDASRAGWSAAAKGRWRVVRDGLPVDGQSLSTRSRGDFAYGSGLGQAAGEVVDAVAAHIANIVVRVPEPATLPPVLLPPVVAKDTFETTDPKLAADAGALRKPLDKPLVDQAPEKSGKGKSDTAPARAKSDKVKAP